MSSMTSNSNSLGNSSILPYGSSSSSNIAIHSSSSSSTVQKTQSTFHLIVAHNYMTSPNTSKRNTIRSLEPIFFDILKKDLKSKGIDLEIHFQDGDYTFENMNSIPMNSKRNISMLCKSYTTRITYEDFRVWLIKCMSMFGQYIPKTEIDFCMMIHRTQRNSDSGLNMITNDHDPANLIKTKFASIGYHIAEENFAESTTYFVKECIKQIADQIVKINGTGDSSHSPAGKPLSSKTNTTPFSSPSMTISPPVNTSTSTKPSPAVPTAPVSTTNTITSVNPIDRSTSTPPAAPLVSTTATTFTTTTAATIVPTIDLTVTTSNSVNVPVPVSDSTDPSPAVPTAPGSMTNASTSVNPIERSTPPAAPLVTTTATTLTTTTAAPIVPTIDLAVTTSNSVTVPAPLSDVSSVVSISLPPSNETSQISAPPQPSTPSAPIAPLHAPHHIPMQTQTLVPHTANGQAEVPAPHAQQQQSTATTLSVAQPVTPHVAQPAAQPVQAPAVPTTADVPSTTRKLLVDAAIVSLFSAAAYGYASYLSLPVALTVTVATVSAIAFRLLERCVNKLQETNPLKARNIRVGGHLALTAISLTALHVLKLMRIRYMAILAAASTTILVARILLNNRNAQRAAA